MNIRTSALMSERSERLLATIRKNSREEILVTNDGRATIALRVWFRSKSGEMRPSRDGIDFHAELVDEIIGALQAGKGDTP
jgi:hypothetical protein